MLTTHVAYEKSPVWSPDSKRIAFASDRYGNLDVFVTSAGGGPAKRLTFHSAADVPTCFTPDGNRIFFESRRRDSVTSCVGDLRKAELYSIPVTGGRPRQELTTPAELAVLSPDGKQLAYHDFKGVEDPWRKHHVSPVTRDVWIYDLEAKTHRKLTDFPGEDRNPAWQADGKALFFLSERSGTFNVWQMDPAKPGKARQVTRHTVHPVRFLSVDRNGSLVYGYHGQIWRLPVKGKAERVDVAVTAAGRENDVQRETLTGGATEFAVAAEENEIAFVVRGEVFVTSVKHNTTKRVTDTPEQERSVVWSSDGRTLYYAGEREGAWSLFGTTITRDDEKDFSVATLLTEEPVLTGEDETFQPLLSPDGKKIAYLHDRDEIRVLDLDTKKSTELVPGGRNYSYRDGDITYAWSPDSRWLAFSYLPHRRWIDSVGIANVATSTISNVTDSGYYESSPQWSRDGKALYFLSDRQGRRPHGSWGTEDDIFGFYLTRSAWEWINLTEEELERRKKEDDEDRAKKGDEDNKKDGEDDNGEDEDEEDPEDETPPVEIDLKGIDGRTKRLTLMSAPISSYAVSPDGETAVYFAEVENKWDLWVSKVRTKSTYKLAALGADEGGKIRFAKDGKSVFVLNGGKLSKVAVPESGPGEVESIGFSAEMDVHRPRERAYMFEHVWRQAKRKFYRDDLHRADWDGLKESYAAFLPSINNTRDFVELLSEMLGELNASHTGARYRPKSTGDKTASLGLFFDGEHQGTGLLVEEVIRRGPADREDSNLAPGVLVTKINGVHLAPNVNPHELLNGQAGKPVRLALTDPEANKDWEELIKPISRTDERELLYERWIRGREELVERLSKGRIGYVHVRSMNDSSFRRVFRDVLGKNSDKEALIVDTRFNSGGWLHDDLVTFLNGEDYLTFQPRGKKLGEMGSEPCFRWSRPVAVVQSEGNYSDAHMFPFAFKQLGIGKLVGTPVAGTGTAVWWERLIDGVVVFGIPQVGMVTPEGKYLENLQLDPDVLVFNTPESVANGEDRQLAKAVQVLLVEANTRK